MCTSLALRRRPMENRWLLVLQPTTRHRGRRNRMHLNRPVRPQLQADIEQMVWTDEEHSRSISWT